MKIVAIILSLLTIGTIGIICCLFMSCAELSFDAELPDVHVHIGFDGGVDGGYLDIGIDDIDFNGMPVDALVVAESKKPKAVDPTTATTDDSPSLSTLPVRSR